jgi:hypothetical protein
VSATESDIESLESERFTEYGLKPTDQERKKGRKKVYDKQNFAELMANLERCIARKGRQSRKV